MSLEPSNSTFPLKSRKDIVDLFKSELEKEEPNLCMLSLVLGFVENQLTCNKTQLVSGAFPVFDLGTFQSLYSKYTGLLERELSFNSRETPHEATREVIKRVADVVWSSLAKSYFKDKPHIQTLYTFLTGNRLDCFGVAYTVVAICQHLGYPDVKLALSEDHAWVTFGRAGKETAEVTWHGRGNEDKRGTPIDMSMEDIETSWLYLGGYPVQCTKHMAVASLVSVVNPSINSTTDSKDLGILQQELLQLLYDMGHLKRYPMAVASLADLEEIAPTPGRPSAESLFQEAVDIAREYYNNQHVYPYTMQGAYYYRQGEFYKAMKSWADASSVAARYNYTKEDEEMYKELQEIANDYIPNMFKKVLSGSKDGGLVSDASFFAMFLEFYDGLCLWEEGSQTPVLHAEWAKHLVRSVTRFTPECRLALEGDQEEDGKGEVNSQGSSHSQEAGSGEVKSSSAKSRLALFVLKSVKMQAMRKLLTNAGKLNTSAIRLQLTAQSQVSVLKSKRKHKQNTDYIYDYDDEIEQLSDSESEPKQVRYSNF